MKNNEAIWTERKEELKNMTVELYSSMFTTDSEVEGEFIKRCFPTIEEEVQQELEAEYSITETWRALKEMGSWKAPVADGY